MVGRASRWPTIIVDIIILKLYDIYRAFIIFIKYVKEVVKGIWQIQLLSPQLSPALSFATKPTGPPSAQSKAQSNIFYIYYFD